MSIDKEVQAAGNHETVLLNEAVNSLVWNSSGCYVDATFGRGGHSHNILKKLDVSGVLVGIDKDIEAVSQAKTMFAAEGRFKMIHGSFADIDNYLSSEELGAPAGILADLGVSSPQLDNAERGFSFMNDGPLDMRMDTTVGLSASQWLAESDESEIARVLREYGEEKFSRRIARAIADAMKVGPIETTLELAKIVSEANPSWEKNKHPATRSFQAIRIKINNELGDLELFLERAANGLAVGGRLVVISFHSLEDRIVKRFMREKSKGNAPPPGVPVFEKDIVRNYKILGKAIKPSKEEIEINVRARSAVMRVLEKVSDD